MKIGFDNEKYLKIQSEHIRERIAQFGDKLYLELGGKLFDDHHASRVLPGFKPDSKLRMLAQLRDELEIVIVVSADDIEKNKVRADLGITYDEDVLRLREEFMDRDFMVGSVVITHYNGQHAADQFRHRLERMGIRSYIHYLIDGYPHNVELIASDEGFGKNDYVETSRQLVIVTAPGPGSGKMAVCLSQLYNENKRGIRAGYAKFETFPVWNLPLKHPVNIAYEAATADLNDVNMIDPFHLEAYDKIAVNYNRDIEIFPVLTALFEGIYGENPYKSPTDMGVNMVGFCISDDEVCCQASRDEIIRRYYNATNKLADGYDTEKEVSKILMLFNQAKITTAYRRVTGQAGAERTHRRRHRVRGRHHHHRQVVATLRLFRSPAAERHQASGRHRPRGQAHPPEHDRPHSEDEDGIPRRQEPPPAYRRGAGSPQRAVEGRRAMPPGIRAAAQAARLSGTLDGDAQRGRSQNLQEARLRPHL